MNLEGTRKQEIMDWLLERAKRRTWILYYCMYKFILIWKVHHDIQSDFIIANCGPSYILILLIFNTNNAYTDDVIVYM